MNPKTKKINTTIVLLLGLSLAVYVGLGILFPSFSYFMTERGPLTKSLLLKAQQGEEYYLSIKPEFDLEYHQLKLNLAGDFKKANFPKELKIFRGYLAQLNPPGEEINSEEELRNLIFGGEQKIANGSLVAKGGAVYFVSRGKKFPFISQEAFSRLGFDWEAVEEAPEEFDDLEKGDKITLSSLHPDGVLLKDRQGQIYLVWEEQKRLVDKNLVEKIWPEANYVMVDSAEPVSQGTVQLKKENEKELLYSAKLSQENGEKTGGYLFQIKQPIFSGANDGEVRLSTWGNFQWSTAKHSLVRIKQLLLTRYANQL